METIEIPRKDWTSTVDRFCTAHEGWLISLELLAPDLGAQHAFENLPLLSMTVDEGNGGAIHLSAEQPRGELVTHAVARPARLYLERTAEGADSALLIEDADGTRAVLKLRSPVRPETVDGIAGR